MTLPWPLPWRSSIRLSCWYFWAVPTMTHLMLGLLVAGCAVARRNHILVGLALCALAAEVKVPALIGALFIGWWWSDGAASWRQRAARVAGAVLIAVALMVVIGLASGLGWRWLDGLSNPGVVVSWVDPVTAVGLALSHASQWPGSRRTLDGVCSSRPGGGGCACCSHFGRPGASISSGATAGPRMEPSGVCGPRTSRVALVRNVGIRIPCCGRRGMDPATAPGIVGHRLFCRPPERSLLRDHRTCISPSSAGRSWRP